MYDIAYLSTAYLPPISYFSKLYHYNQIGIEIYSNYTKQTYRNRCNIIGANGIMPISIPIIKPLQSKCPDKDIRISDHDNWQHLHWNAIVSAYGSTPFFEYYQDDLLPFYKKNLKGYFLLDFNSELLSTVCEWLNISPDIHFTNQYKMTFTSKEKDFREAIHPKHSNDKEFIPLKYYQIFSGKYGFIPDMSIIDLIFNMGPESILILNNSIKKHISI